jgi:hypothetical protein
MTHTQPRVRRGACMDVRTFGTLARTHRDTRAGRVALGADGTPWRPEAGSASLAEVSRRIIEDAMSDEGLSCFAGASGAPARWNGTAPTESSGSTPQMMAPRLVRVNDSVQQTDFAAAKILQRRVRDRPTQHGPDRASSFFEQTRCRGREGRSTSPMGATWTSRFRAGRSARLLFEWVLGLSGGSVPCRRRP